MHARDSKSDDRCRNVKQTFVFQFWAVSVMILNKHSSALDASASCYPRVPLSTSEYPWVPQSSLEYPRVAQRSLERLKGFCAGQTNEPELVLKPLRGLKIISIWSFILFCNILMVVKSLGIKLLNLNWKENNLGSLRCGFERLSRWFIMILWTFRTSRA